MEEPKAGECLEGAEKEGPAESGSADSIWIEKYRPQTLDDVVGNEEVLQKLRLVALEGNMPHLLLAVRLTELAKFGSFCQVRLFKPRTLR